MKFNKLCKLAIAYLIMISNCSFAHEPMPHNKNRLWQKVNYLKSANYGIYELVFNQKENKVFAAVIDRINREANIGFIEGYNPKTLEQVSSFKMPFRVFSLAQNNKKNWLYAGHTQISRISIVDAATGKVLRTTEPLNINKNSQHHHLRHLAFNHKTNELFVTHVDIVGNSHADAKQVVNLVVLDGDTLAVKQIVNNAYPSVGYGLALDEVNQKIYTTGEVIQQIDIKTKKVVKTINSKNLNPIPESLNEITIDPKGRILVNQFITGGNGAYVIDSKTGKQLAFLKANVGTNMIAYNPKYNEIFVGNFNAGTISIFNGKNYELKKELRVPIFPNALLNSPDNSTLYVGVKEGFNRDWNPEEYIEGAKERIMSISLDPDKKQPQTIKN